MNLTDSGADDAPIMLNIGQCARVARKHRERIHVAMVSGELPFTRDGEGHRVAKAEDLFAWMRRGARKAVAA